MVFRKLKGRERAQLAIWGCFNIVLPLLPILIKLAINIASKKQILIINDGELLYYNLILCLLHVDLIKSINSCSEVIYSIIICIIGIVDIVFIVIMYTDLATSVVSGYSIVLAIIMPISLMIRKLLKELSVKEGAKID